MEQGTTKKLEEVLLNLDKQEELEEYLKDGQAINKYKSISEYLNNQIAIKDKNVAEIIKNSGIERTYAYQILNGTRTNPSKDKIIRLCLATGLGIKETIRALEIAGSGTLYARDKRDAIILFSINNKCTVDDTNILLDQFSCDILQ